MELDEFLAGLKELGEDISEKTEILENDRKEGFRCMPDLIGRLAVLMPQWLGLIEQTQTGTKEDIFAVLQDMEDAMRQEDSVLLADALLFGLGTMTEEYCGMIDEALHEE